MSPIGNAIFAHLDALAQFSESSANLTRTFMTNAHRAAAEQLLTWMREAGMAAHMDAVGNVIGRYEGTTPGLPALVVGSHYDTVTNAGKYDGMLGVLVGIACVDALVRANERFPFAIEVIGFSEEEGVRYQATLLGSRGMAGTFDLDLLDRKDADGVSMAKAMDQYGLDPAAVSDAARDPADILCYVEAHIEQGPVLLQQDLPVGVVTSIAGATRYRVTFSGPGGHAGTVPMNLRHDPLNAAAEVAMFIEKRCTEAHDAFGTVGEMNILNGATNKIPVEVEFSIDLRAGSDATRVAIVDDLMQKIEEISTRRGVTMNIDKTHEASAASCDQGLIAQLESAVKSNGIQPLKLVSGAGHDAMALTELTKIAMLFVRCGNGGISHHPDETMTADDAGIAANVLLAFIRNFKPSN